MIKFTVFSLVTSYGLDCNCGSLTQLIGIVVKCVLIFDYLSKLLVIVQVAREKSLVNSPI